MYRVIDLRVYATITIFKVFLLDVVVNCYKIANSAGGDWCAFSSIITVISSYCQILFLSGWVFFDEVPDDIIKYVLNKLITTAAEFSDEG